MRSYRKFAIFAIIGLIVIASVTFIITTFVLMENGSAPVIQNITSPLLACEDSYFSYLFNVTDIDEDYISLYFQPVYPFYIKKKFSEGNLTVGEILSVLLTKEHVGTYEETTWATDGRHTDNRTFNITVIEINHPPSVENIPTQTVQINNVFYYEVKATDLEDGSTKEGNLTFSLTFLASTKFFDINKTTGVMNVTLNISNVGVYNISVCVSDRGIVNPHENLILCNETADSDSACTNFSLVIVADTDNDGLMDLKDVCPTTPGKLEYQGCPIGDDNVVEMHIIDTTETNSSKISKIFVENAEIRVFDRNNPNFQTKFTKNPKATEYPDVFEAGIARIGKCTTNSNGKCIAGEERKGEYLVIVKFVDIKSGKIVYTGKLKNQEDFVDTDGDGIGDLAYKNFLIVKLIKKDGIFFRAGAKAIINGSVLEVIYPQYTIWEENNTLYPFIFSSETIWEVDICVYVPEGYQVVNSNCNQVFLANETKEIIFSTVEVSSPEPNVEVDVSTKHNGKVKKVKLNVPGKKSKEYKAKRS